MERAVTSVSDMRASRLMGALLLGTFGTIWLILWAYRAFGGQMVAIILTASPGIVLLSWIYVQYRRHSRGISAKPESADSQRASKLFHIINVGQWVVILVAGNVLANIGLSAWVLPMAMLVIGVHFFPLARLFRTPSRNVTGTALIAVAVVYPLVSSRGAADPIGCLFAGIVLWASALWSVRHDG